MPVTTDMVAAVRRDGVLVLTVTPPEAPADPVTAWLVDAPAELLAAVRGQTAERIALVVEVPGSGGALAEGLAWAVRGIAQSLALELAPATRVNAVLCDPGAGLEPTLVLLGGPDGGFVTGAHIDLREAP